MRFIYIALILNISATLLQSADNFAALRWGEFTHELPVLFINVTNQIQRETPTKCAVYAFTSDKTNSESANQLSASIRIHGATSSGYPKTSFKLNFDKPISLCGFTRRTHWVLNAAFIDRSLMRHKLSYDLFRSLSTPDAPRYASGSAFVEVFLNSNYHGVYLLMERVDKQLLNLRPFNSNDFSHAVIYKAEDHAANFGAPGHNGFEQNEPDPQKKVYWSPLDESTKFVSTAPDTQLFDPQTGITSRLDILNAIDFHLLVLLTSNSDGITKNFIFARDAQTDAADAKKFFFVPWDYDGTFGRNWDGRPYPHNAWLTNPMFERLIRNPDYRKQFAARWKQLRQNQFSENTIIKMIDTNAKTLGDAVKRNSKRWESALGYYPDRVTFEEDIAQMKNWVSARLKWLDEEINRIGSR